jgi:hypothetical protein
VNRSVDFEGQPLPVTENPCEREKEMAPDRARVVTGFEASIDVDREVSLQTVRQQLIGSWRLVSYEIRGSDGPVTYPMGQNVTGFIMYVPDGYMSANLMVPRRPAFSGGGAASATPAELAAAAAGYFAYAGRFEVDESAALVLHHIDVCLIPNMVGSTQRRYITLEGSRLTLRGDPMPAGDRVVTPFIIWDRVSPE